MWICKSWYNDNDINSRHCIIFDGGGFVTKL